MLLGLCFLPAFEVVEVAAFLAAVASDSHAVDHTINRRGAALVDRRHRRLALAAVGVGTHNVVVVKTL